MKVFAYLLIIFFVTAQSNNHYKESLITYGGFPKSTKQIKILVNSAFAIGYSEEMKNPVSKDLKTYIVTVREIETLTGIDFFSKLSKRKQNNLETVKGQF